MNLVTGPRTFEQYELEATLLRTHASSMAGAWYSRALAAARSRSTPWVRAYLTDVEPKRMTLAGQFRTKGCVALPERAHWTRLQALTCGFVTN